ncbi:MAG: hypothetical protein QOJ22_1115 [Thermoleophilaceae bacterium]|nr:hypothetical protein [Thermoleophilaceae bacterium]
MRRNRVIAPLLLAAALIAPAAARAADIEAVWSFSGGQVAVTAEADGTFSGTVIRATTLANCAHPVGETMWLAVRPQADGQYWGGHQWFRDAGCEPIAQRGNTAYRVLQRPDGARFLRVCFAPPETPEVQPSIAPDGTPTDASRDCVDSDLVAPLAAGTPKVDQIATLPRQGAKRCLSRRSFKIRLKEPRGDALEQASVYVNGRRVEVRRGERLTAPINLRGLPKGRYTVRIVATTVLGKTIKGSRKYRTCATKRRGSNRGPV